MNDKERLAQAKMGPQPKLEVEEAPLHRNAPLAVRMRARVKEADNGCWEWQGQINNIGHAIVGYKADHGWTTTTAHRKYWELTNGPIPDGIQVNHKCDNRRCINPDHMFLGTQLDNIHDMIEKGRDNFWGWNGPKQS